MVGRCYPGCPPVQRFVKGHIYAMCHSSEEVGEFSWKSQRAYVFNWLASNGIRYKSLPKQLRIQKKDIFMYAIKEVPQEDLPLYLNYLLTPRYHQLLSSTPKILEGEKCPVRFNDLSVITSA